MTLQVREYARLSRAPVGRTSLDRAQVSEATFNWLSNLLQDAEGGTLPWLGMRGPDELRLGSFVGYLETPWGEGIEILPKTERGEVTDIQALRTLLHKMLKAARGISPQRVQAASLHSTRQPLHEWIFSEFLASLGRLVRCGLKFDYQRCEDEMTFVRGQLDMQRQLRQTPDRAVRFHVRYDEYTPGRVENRLLRTALEHVLSITGNHQNWRAASRLRDQLAGIEPLNDPRHYLKSWSEDKLLIDYREVRPWCQLIIEQLDPHFQQGLHRGIALLFAMETLYECYLGQCLKEKMDQGFKLTAQASRHSLVTHKPVGAVQDQSFFKLRPDFVIDMERQGEAGELCHVLDAKWKLIDSQASDTHSKYGISQGDLYQMLAYGEKYLNGKGHLMLIYPRHRGFLQPLPAFRFNERLSLWCVPFDMHSGALVGGEWQAGFAAIHRRKSGMSSAECFNEYATTDIFLHRTSTISSVIR